MDDKETGKTKSTLSKKKKIILALVGVSILIFGGYVTTQKVGKYSDARDHMTPEQINMYEELGRKERF